MDYPIPPICSVFESPDKLFTGMRRVNLIDDRAHGLMSAQQIAAYAFEKQQQWGSVLVVLNTRSAARRTFDALVQSERMDVELYLLSNDLCPAHRKTIIDILHNATERPCICVSTQLIECGVDLSFDAQYALWQALTISGRQQAAVIGTVMAACTLSSSLSVLKKIWTS